MEYPESVKLSNKSKVKCHTEFHASDGAVSPVAASSMNAMGAASETNLRTTKLDYTTPRAISPYSKSGRTHIRVVETRANSPSPLYAGIEPQEMISLVCSPNTPQAEVFSFRLKPKTSSVSEPPELGENVSVSSPPNELVRIGHPNPRCTYSTDAPARTCPAQRQQSRVFTHVCTKREESLGSRQMVNALSMYHTVL